MSISESTTCLACGSNSSFKKFEVREAMLGIKDAHEYGECQCCGSIQNLYPPSDLGKYYPSSYYSLNRKKEHPLIGWLRTQRACSCLGEFNLIGALTRALLGKPYFIPWLKRTNVDRNSAKIGRAHV